MIPHRVMIKTQRNLRGIGRLIFLKTNCNKKSKAFKNPGNLLLYYGSLRVVFLRENTINLKHHSHLYFLSGVLFDFLQPEYFLPTIAGAPTIAGCLPDSFKNRDKNRSVILLLLSMSCFGSFLKFYSSFTYLHFFLSTYINQESL